MAARKEAEEKLQLTLAGWSWAAEKRQKKEDEDEDEDEDITMRELAPHQILSYTTITANSNPTWPPLRW